MGGKKRGHVIGLELSLEKQVQCGRVKDTRKKKTSGRYSLKNANMR